MSSEIKVPVLPESVSDATIVTWHKKVNEAVKRDEHLVDIETDKVVLEVVAPADGFLSEILKPAGSLVLGEEIIGHFNAGVAAKSEPAAKPSANSPLASALSESSPPSNAKSASSPEVRRLMAELDLQSAEIVGSGKQGRVTKEDVLKAAKAQVAETKTQTASISSGTRQEQRVPMSRLRAKIAERLVSAQHTAAILTTFNEVNMAPVMQLRNRFKEGFEKKHGVKLGFMSFFTLAVIAALKRFPAVNASIDGADIVYHNYFDIGIAVSSTRGLVVPVLRDANTLSVAEIERSIAALGKKASDGQLSIEEMTGGTFTISNGGVFGSLMSTPILNPPQSAILGMHKIEERPVVDNGQIVIRPMMYLALSYDHRIIDGRDSVQFLVAIKEALEEPARLLMDC